MSSPIGSLPPFEILEWQLYDGLLPQDQLDLFMRMKPIVEDMNRPDDLTLYLWYEICQWKWKQREYAWVLSHLDLNATAGRKVMDAGCGYMPLIRYLASIGMEAYGFDLDDDKQTCSLAKSSTLLFGNLVRFQKQDIRAMNWPSDYFDYTLSVSVLEHLYRGQGFFQRVFDKFLPRTKKYFHIQTVRQTLHELIRVTRPGGLIVLTMDCGYGGGLPIFVIEKLLNIRILNFPDIETIRSYWRSDEYYTAKNRILPSTPREYTAFMCVLKKPHVR